MVTVKRLLRGMSVALVVAALGFGTTQLLAATATACNEPGQVGTCPLLDEITCPQACMDVFGNPGQCFRGCCQCVI